MLDYFNYLLIRSKKLSYRLFSSILCTIFINVIRQNSLQPLLMPRLRFKTGHSFLTLYRPAMTEDWSIQLKRITTTPETLAGAVARLLAVLNSEQKLMIAVMAESDLTDLHRSLGKATCKAFAMHEPDSALVADCGVTRADDAAKIIVREVWKALTE